MYDCELSPDQSSKKVSHLLTQLREATPEKQNLLLYGYCPNGKGGGGLNPIENVLIGLSEFKLINATTVLESTPPLKNAPKGTSLIILILTDSFNVS